LKSRTSEVLWISIQDLTGEIQSEANVVLVPLASNFKIE